MSDARTAAQAALAKIMADRAAKAQATAAATPAKAAVPAAPTAAAPPAPKPNAALLAKLQAARANEAKTEKPAVQQRPALATVPIDNTEATVLKRMEQIQAALLANDPAMREYLTQMHQQLLKFPELLYVLKPEQIGTMVQAATRVAGVDLTTSVEKRKDREVKASLKKMSVDEL